MSFKHHFEPSLDGSICRQCRCSPNYYEHHEGTALVAYDEWANGLSVLARKIDHWQKTLPAFKNRTALSAAKHMRKEIGELIEVLEKIEAAQKSGDPFIAGLMEKAGIELADIFLLSISTAGSLCDDDAEEFMRMFISKKFDVVQKRVWAEPGPDGVVEHDRSIPGNE